jgi:hypothetical protein
MEQTGNWSKSAIHREAINEEKPVDFEEWKESVPQSIRSEKFWSLVAHQKSLYFYDLLREDSRCW